MEQTVNIRIEVAELQMITTSKEVLGSAIGIELLVRVNVTPAQVLVEWLMRVVTLPCAHRAQPLLQLAVTKLLSRLCPDVEEDRVVIPVERLRTNSIVDIREASFILARCVLAATRRTIDVFTIRNWLKQSSRVPNNRFVCEGERLSWRHVARELLLLQGAFAALSHGDRKTGETGNRNAFAITLHAARNGESVISLLPKGVAFSIRTFQAG